MGDTYTHGHHASVLRSHEWRTVENSAGYLLGRLRPGQRLLDVGCGPGTITVELAALVAPGPVLGIDASAEVIGRAAALAAAGDEPAAGGGPAAGDGARAVPIDLRFEVGDIYALDHSDDSFDVVHAHQVLQHLSDPIAALREMRRVLAPGGTLAVRDSDYGGFVWSPGDERLTRWLALYHQVTERNGAEADAGRRLPAWVRAAGFTDISVTSSTWTFADFESRAWWGDLWADRVQHSAFATQAVEYGLSDAVELATLADGWRSWAADPDGYLAILHTEVLAAPQQRGSTRSTSPAGSSQLVSRRVPSGPRRGRSGVQSHQVLGRLAQVESDGTLLAMPAPTDPRLVVAEQALERAGAGGGPAESIVVRDGLSLLVRRHDVVVRVRDRAQEPTAEREVAVARALAAVGMAHTALVAPDAQPWAIGGSVVTAWRWTDPVRTAEPADLGSLVAGLRARTGKMAGDVPRFDPLAAAVGAVAHVPPGDDQGDFVRERARKLTSSWALVTDHDPAGTSIVHGDLHRDNVVVGVDGPLLTDLELAGSGPPSYDVAHAAIIIDRFAADPASLDVFIGSAGWDPRGWQGFATCVAVAELWATAWAVGVRDRAPQVAAEAALRVACLRDGASHTWHLL